MPIVRISAYRRANELAGGTSVEALLGLGIACDQEKRYSESLEAARQMLELTDDEGMLTAANNLLGISLLGLTDRTTTDLEEAERAFRNRAPSSCWRSSTRRAWWTTSRSILMGMPYGLNEATVKAVKKWRFKPATLDREPIAFHKIVRIEFRIRRWPH